MTPTITFLGAAGTVTGSKYLIERSDHRVLLDCGLFQGYKALRLKNWEPLVVGAQSLASVVLSHAHLDHSGYLPRLVKDGFHGDVYCSGATRELCEILLPDAGHLEERAAEFANRHGFSKHKPALPLFTEDDARAALPYLRPVSFGENKPIHDSMEFKLRRAGHILGASSIELKCGGTTIAFSGDLGRFNDVMMPAPELIPEADYLVVESTYGDRLHDKRDPQDVLAQVINPVIERGGTVIVPAFAVGRAQLVLYYLHRLKAAGRLPKTLPVYLDSPMATDASDLYCRYGSDHNLTEQECRSLCSSAIYVRDPEESKRLTANETLKVIVSASGMATGGRVLHHIKHYAPHPQNAIVFAGFQAGGTRGAALVAGADTIKIHGTYIPVRAAVANIETLSAHADSDEIMRWLGGFRKPPRTTFITHGEPNASDTLRRRIEETLGWNCSVPEHGQRVALS